MNKGYIRQHRCERTKKAYKYKIFCIYTHVYNEKDIGINKEIEICLPNKESLSGNGFERTNIAAKCYMFMNYSKNFIGICKKKMAGKQIILKGDIDVEEQIWLTNINI